MTTAAPKSGSSQVNDIFASLFDLAVDIGQRFFNAWIQEEFGSVERGTTATPPPSANTNPSPQSFLINEQTGQLLILLAGGVLLITLLR